jgi:hypothetical protein
MRDEPRNVLIVLAEDIYDRDKDSNTFSLTFQTMPYHKATKLSGDDINSLMKLCLT